MKISKQFRKWNNILHRDLGYFFSGTVIIYSLSGIAVNHVKDWNPNFIINRQDITVDEIPEKDAVNKEWILTVLGKFDESSNYKSHDFPTSEKVKIYLKDGSVFIDLRDGKGVYETVKRRPLFYSVNFLHLHPQKWWLIFSDVFAVCLIFISVSGLFVLKGRKGIKGRGAWLVSAGLLFPLFFMLTL